MKDTPSVQPKILYKYIGASKLKFYFPKLTLAFPHIDLLNDPFEANIQSTLDYTKNLKWIPPRYRNPVVKYRIGQVTDYGINPLYEKHEESKEYEDALESNKRLDELMNFLVYCRNSLGILSLTTDPLNSLMWAHYADNHKGLCIGFNVEHEFFKYSPRQPSFNNYTDLFSLLRVRYRSERPNYKGLDKCEYILNAFGTKFIQWSYENEYRFLRVLSEGEKVLIQEPPKDLIKEVYIGMNSGINLNYHGGVSEEVEIYKVNYKHDGYRLIGEQVKRS